MTQTTTIALADIYLRLSAEESGRGESSSINNQRQIIHQYCLAHNIGIAREFVDDGYSGSNFNRPGFNQMLQHLATGEVTMVITKDLSRLGRDMTESSQYAERIFPEMGLRYIAISDNFDSDEINTIAPFLFAMNDVYLRDVSRKIKAVLQSKRARGEYCCAAPFGYMKDPNDTTRLVPNPETAPIVQSVFRMAAEGKTCHWIADYLTEQHVVTPSRYKASVSSNYTDRGLAKVVDHWCHTTVKRMLKNEVYLGKTQLGKSKKVSLKSQKKVEIPKSQWYQFENTHMPLVNQRDFDLVGHYMRLHSKNWRDGDNIRRSVFNGKVFCAHCHSAMCSAGTTYKGEKMKYWFLYCNAPTRSSEKSCNHRARIRYHDLVSIVTNELNTLTTLSDEDRQRIVDAACAKRKTVYRAANTSKAIEATISSLQSGLSKLYCDKASGLIDDTVFSMTLQRMTEDLQKAQKDLDTAKQAEGGTDDLSDHYEKFWRLLDEIAPVKELTVEIIHAFIDRIEIGEQILPDGYQKRTNPSIPMTQQIKIYYKFIGQLGSAGKSDDSKISAR